MNTQAFLAAMAGQLEWPQVFGPQREMTARKIAAVLRAQRPTESERVVAALGFGSTRRVAAYDNGAAWFRANYYEHSALLER